MVADLPCKIAIVNSRPELNQTFVKSISYGCHTFIHENIGLSIVTFYLYYVALPTVNSFTKVMHVKIKNF